jgi:hypothetical protein
MKLTATTVSGVVYAPLTHGFHVVWLSVPRMFWMAGCMLKHNPLCSVTAARKSVGDLALYNISCHIFYAPSQSPTAAINWLRC